VLGTEQEPALVDTLVMSNLGYFQLKALPGAFLLQLAQGRSQELYAVDNSTQGVDAQVSAHSNNISLLKLSPIQLHRWPT
jgi:UDP-glucose:glycoprotein glucosyltransferase